MAEDNAPTARTRLRRLPQRGSHERERCYAILDDSFVCQIAFADGADGVATGVRQLPTGYTRDGEWIYVHGKANSHMLRMLTENDVCVTVTQVFGLVVARSAFHHSVNYSSVVIFGRFEEITGQEEKMHAARIMTNGFFGGANRFDDCRQPSPAELTATAMLRLRIAEFSCKERRGGPADDKEDMALNHWAGVLPMRTLVLPAEDAEDLSDTADRAPDYVRNYRRPVTSDSNFECGGHGRGGGGGGDGGGNAQGCWSTSLLLHGALILVAGAAGFLLARTRGGR